MTMTLAAHNDADATGDITDRPAVSLPSVQLGTDAENDLIVAAIHGAGTNTLRLVLFQRSGNQLERVAISNATGKIIGSPALAVVRSDMLITAVHGKESNRLKLMTWRVGHDHGIPTITRLHDSGNQLGEPSGSADLVWVGGSRLVVAQRTSGGHLRVTVHGVDSHGAITKRADSGSQDGEISEGPSICDTGPINTPDGTPSTAEVGTIVVTTAVRTGGSLRLYNWDVDHDNVHRRADSGDQGGTIEGRPAIAAWPGANKVVTAVHAAQSGRLKLIGWDIPSAHQITRRADTEFVGVRMVNSPSIAFAQRFNVPAFGTAITMEDGQKLRVHLWNINDDLLAITEF